MGDYDMEKENINDLRNINFEDLEKAIYSYVCDMAKAITIKVLKDLDDKIAKERDTIQFSIKQRRKTCIKTVFGEVEYYRRQYYDNENKTYRYLLDEDIKMEKIGTVSANLGKLITEAALEMPYRKAADSISKTTGQVISSHGAWDVVQKVADKIKEDEKKKLNELNTNTTTGTKETRLLFQEADGVYLKIQKDKKKAKPQEIKVATVYDGWNPDGSLHNKVVYAGFEKPEEFHNKVEAQIQSKFKIDYEEVRIINGDGASWINNTYMDDTIFQLDRFHIMKKIRTCISDKRIYRNIIHKFIDRKYDDMLDYIETYINSIDDGTNKNEVKNATDLLNYLKNNYDGLEAWQEQVDVEPVDGIEYKNMGVQENQNCSLITLRMKGRKMRWSVEGANNLAKLAYTRANGELDRIIEELDGSIELQIEKNVTAKDISATVGCRGTKYIKQIQASVPCLNHANTSLRKALAHYLFSI